MIFARTLFLHQSLTPDRNTTWLLDLHISNIIQLELQRWKSWYRLSAGGSCSQQKTKMPTGVVSGCRRICLAVVGVHNKARLLTHLHMSLACLQLPPENRCILLKIFPFIFLLRAKTSSSIHFWQQFARGVLRRASYLSWRLSFEGLGTGQRRLTWQSHPPLAQSGSDVSVSDESLSFSRGTPWPLSEIIHYFVAQRQAWI